MLPREISRPAERACPRCGSRNDQPPRQGPFPESAAGLEKTYSTIVETMFDGVWVVDTNAVTTYVNRRLADLLGCAPADIVGRSLTDFVDPSIDLSDHNLVRRQGGQPATHDLRLRRRDGSEVWTLMSTNSLADAEGRYAGAVGIVVDITARKQIEDRVLRLNEDLEARVRARTSDLEAANRELEAFSYTVSHDLRAPLRTISGFCRILQREHASELSPAAARYLGLVADGAAQMARLVDDLLAFSRLSRQAIQVQRCRPAEIVAQVIQELHADTEGRAIDWRIHPLPEVDADARLLHQVFLNLLSNAVKFTRGRSPAVVDVSCASDPERGLVFHVADNGVGFDMQYADKLFGVFQRLHRAEDYEGTGVGLAIVQRALKRLGGRVWPHAILNGGATFSFTVRTRGSA